MIVDAIVLYNFAHYRGEHVLDLRGKRAVAICGENDTGKSALLDAVSCAFYGYTRAGKGPGACVSRGALEMRVEVHLSGGAVVKRGWKGAGTVDLTGWEDAQVGDADAAIRRLLGATREDFAACNMVGQGEVALLAEMPQADRKRLVESWVANPSWARLAATATTGLKRATTDADQLTGMVAGYEAVLGRGSAELLDAAEIGRLGARHTAALQALTDARYAVQMYKPPAEPPAPAIPLEDAEAAALEAKLQEEVRVAERNCRSFDGGCPVTATPCPAADHVRAQVEPLQNRLTVVTGAWYNAKADVRRRDRDQAVAQSQWAKACDDIRAQALRERQQLDKAVTAAATAESALRAELASASATAERSAVAAQALGECRERLAVAQKRAAILTYIARMFGRDGIPASEVDRAVASAEAAACAMLADAGFDFRIRFRRGRELSKRAATCDRCGSAKRQGGDCVDCGSRWPFAKSDDLDLLIEEGGVEEDWRLKGGARRDAGALALRVAFARRSVRLRTIFLDEVTRHFSRTARPQLTGFLLNGLGAYGFDQVICISHDGGELGAAPALLEVRRDGAGSRFHWIR